MIKLSQLISEVQLTKDMRIHMSKSPFELKSRMSTQRLTMKPAGFWYGFGNEWIDWCRSEMPEWVGSYIYEVDIGSSNLLKIKNSEELSEFNREYGVNLSGVNYLRGKSEVIDWRRVANKYDGIEINPYQPWGRGEYIWYSTWDVSSGCVWNLKGIKLKLLSSKGVEE